jgi:hypothetical protein
MMRKNWVRLTIGTVLGGFAGLSLTATILPTILASISMGDSMFIRWQLADYAAHSVLVWAIGGWGVAKVGDQKAGALILGLVGLSVGALLCLGVFGSAPKILAAMTLGGAAYGAVGGLLLGRILEKPQ